MYSYLLHDCSPDSLGDFCAKECPELVITLHMSVKFQQVRRYLALSLVEELIEFLILLDIQLAHHLLVSFLRDDLVIVAYHFFGLSIARR